MKGFAVDFRSVLKGCDIKNKSKTDLQINVAIINALEAVQVNNDGMIIGFLNVAWKQHESDDTKHHALLFSVYQRKYLTITEPQHFQGGATRIKAEYGGLWSWNQSICKKTTGFVDVFPLSSSHSIVWNALIGDLLFAGALSTNTVDKFNAEMLFAFFSKHFVQSDSDTLSIESASSLHRNDQDKL